MGKVGFTDKIESEFWVYVGFSAAALVLIWFCVKIFDKGSKITRSRKADETSVDPWSREALAAQWAKSRYSSLLEIISAILAGVSVVVFWTIAGELCDVEPKAIDDSWTLDDYTKLFKEEWLIWLEFGLSVFFLIDFLIHISLEQNRLDYVFSGSVIVMVATCVAGFLGPVWDFYFYGFQFLRIIRILHSLKFFANKSNTFVPSIVTQVGVVALTIINLFVIAAGFIFVTENNVGFADGLVTTVLDAFYMVTVSLTTVGYGDISPKSPTGKFIVMIMIASGIAIVPAQAERIVRVLRERSSNSQRSYKGQQHIIVMARDSHPVIAFLKEFFHEDRESTTTNVCLMLQDDEVPREVHTTLQDPLYAPRLELLQGKPISEDDLERSRIGRASGLFLFCNKNASDPEDEDAKTILNTFAVRRYDHGVPLFVQVLDPRNKYALRAADANMVVCVNEIRMGTFAQTCICPGFACMLSSLIQSYAPPEGPKAAKYPDWMLEYMYGLGNEVYTIYDMSKFEGMSFSEAAYLLYEKLGILLVGISALTDSSKKRHYNVSRSESSADDAKPRRREAEFFVNPGSLFKITKKHTGIALCQDESIIEQISSTDFKLESCAQLNFKKPKSPCKDASPFRAPDDKQKRQVVRVTLDEALVENVPEDVKNHIVLIGSFGEVSTFILTLANTPLQKDSTVVILSPVLPDDFAWKSISGIPHIKIYFVQGHSTRRYDLERAGVYVAKTVLILGEATKEDALSDARPISVFRLIKAGAALPLIDLVDLSNCKYLGSIGADFPINDDIENPYYAAGQVFSASCLDTLMTQTFFNPGVLPLVEELISGCAFSVSLGDYFPSLVDKTYAELVPAVIENEMIPLALYRKSPDSRLFYTVTNPSPDTKLRDTDYVIVLNVQPKQKARRTTFFSPGMLNVSSANAIKLALSASQKDDDNNNNSNPSSPKQEKKNTEDDKKKDKDNKITKSPSDKKKSPRDEDKKKSSSSPKSDKKKSDDKKDKPKDDNIDLIAENKKKGETTESEESTSDSDSSESSYTSSDNDAEKVKMKEK